MSPVQECRVSKVGAGRPGDEVFGAATGTFAQYAVASVAKLARRPAHLSFEGAAATGVSGCTALQGLAGLSAGQKVLVIGAAGGVGSFAERIGSCAPIVGAFARQKMRGLMAVVRAADLDRLADLGVHPAIDTCYPLANAADALRHLESGRTRGKLVITVADA